MGKERIEEIKKEAIKFEVDQSDVDSYMKRRDRQQKEHEERVSEEKDSYLKSIYCRLIGYSDEVFDNSDSDEEEKRIQELCNKHKAGDGFLMSYISQLDEDHVHLALATLLFDCEGGTYVDCLLEVLKDNLSTEFYIQVLENKYLGYHDT